MPEAIGFDIYSTLVNPLEMNRHLRPLVGDLADRFAQLWRQKQFEYSIRRGLMRKYENFGVCTKQALLFAMYTLKVDLSDEERTKSGSSKSCRTCGRSPTLPRGWRR